MFNIIAFILGLLSLVLVIPGLVPGLGIANWIALPFIVVGIIFGQLSRSDSGRNFCFVILVIAALRLTLGGGWF
ncbi:hypothetical protein [Aurantiacibacter sediminis]|uniref:DUF4175 domain-containing protein n=1 Tax=Aurantiacibacter sediminis TaxID=2793064 RepID=A0ABS0N4E5_9SPHN|nr:hypothetical protein [Aurantiacibacter sediminis]MBH5322121.1 hypothetical protein [Aurantiacibacter sediminis]